MNTEIRESNDELESGSKRGPRGPRQKRVTDLLKQNLKDLEPSARVFVRFDPESRTGVIETREKRYASGSGGKLIELKGEKITEVVTLSAERKAEFSPSEWEISGEHLKILQAAFGSPPHEDAIPELITIDEGRLDVVRASALGVNWTWMTARQGKVAAGKEKEMVEHEHPMLIMTKLSRIPELG